MAAHRWNQDAAIASPGTDACPPQGIHSRPLKSHAFRRGIKIAPTKIASTGCNAIPITNVHQAQSRPGAPASCNHLLAICRTISSAEGIVADYCSDASTLAEAVPTINPSATGTGRGRQNAPRRDNRSHRGRAGGDGALGRAAKRKAQALALTSRARRLRAKRHQWVTRHHQLVTKHHQLVIRRHQWVKWRNSSRRASRSAWLSCSRRRVENASQVKEASIDP